MLSMIAGYGVGLGSLGGVVDGVVSEPGAVVSGDVPVASSLGGGIGAGSVAPGVVAESCIVVSPGCVVVSVASSRPQPASRKAVANSASNARM